MIRLKLIVLSKDATIDSISNQLSILSIIESASSPGFPSVLSESKLVMLFEKDKTDRKTYLINLDLYVNTEKVYGQEFTIDFLDVNRNRTLITIPPIPINKQGHIEFRVNHRTKVLGSYKFEVKKDND